MGYWALVYHLAASKVASWTILHSMNHMYVIVGHTKCIPQVHKVCKIKHMQGCSQKIVSNPCRQMPRCCQPHQILTILVEDIFLWRISYPLPSPHHCQVMICELNGHELWSLRNNVMPSPRRIRKLQKTTTEIFIRSDAIHMHKEGW